MNWEGTGKFGKYETRIYRKSTFLKIFFQNISNGIAFTDENEAKLCDLDNRFSILGKINDLFKLKNNKFEFILEYPEKKTYNRWQQSIFPLDEYNSNGKSVVTDYSPIHIGETFSIWGGLSRSVGNLAKLSLLNGTPGDEGNWAFAVGQYNGATWTHGGQTIYIIPATTPVNIVYLWLKVPPTLYNTCRCFYRTKNHLLSIFLMVSFAC